MNTTVMITTMSTHIIIAATIMMMVVVSMLGEGRSHEVFSEVEVAVKPFLFVERLSVLPA